MKLSIIIPCYNEVKTIENIINKVKKIKLIENFKKEIVVVNDGSNDGTTNILNQIENIILINHQKNLGKGAAINNALKKCSGEIILIQDADLEYNPNDYNILLEPFNNTNIKVVYGSRNLKKNSYAFFSFYIGGIILTKILNILYPKANLTDMHTCYKVFRKEIFNLIFLNSSGFEFCPEVTCKILKHNIKIYEVPISYYPRNILEGKKIKWKDGLIALVTILNIKIFY